MSLNRWKIMAGMLTVSLGGLAAVAAQCQKSDATKSPRKPAEEVALADKQPLPTTIPTPMPLVPAAPGGPTVPNAPPTVLAPSSGPIVPPSIDLPADPSPKLPAVMLPGSYPAPNGVIPPAPTPPAPSLDRGIKKPIEPVEGRTTSTPLPAAPPSEIAPSAPTLPLPLVDKVSENSIEPKKKPEGSAHGIPGIPPPVPTAGVIAPPVTITQPAPPGSQPLGPVEPPVTTAIPASTVPSVPPAPRLEEHVAKPAPTYTEPTPSAPTVVPATRASTPGTGVVPASSMSTSSAKLRIVLRVGEGEPNFEVRSGDDLLLKVICDKVDILSPEKGSGLSSVKARGKVHFAGFGAEGTCDELAFLAGTGEVSMTGNVKIQVKDKLGRIESELATESVKYRIDPSSIGGMLKP